MKNQIKTSVYFKPSQLISYVLFSLAIVNINTAVAATYTTIQNGNWITASTWLSGNIPDEFLSGDTVNIEHDIVYNVNNDLYIESGTLNIYGILDIGNHNIELGHVAGNININSGLILIDNGNLINTSGTVNFSSGAIQICNDNYSNLSSGGTNGNGYIFIDNGNIEDITSSNFSNNIAWCINNGFGTGLPTTENCSLAEPAGGCSDRTHHHSPTHAGGGLWDYSVRWTHNGNDPIGQPNDHITPTLVNTAVISTAANEQSSGITKREYATSIEVDGASINSSVSTSKYFEYQFTTTNFTDIVEVDALSFIVYSMSNPATQYNKSGRYKVAVRIDDDPAFNSPDVLSNAIQIDDTNRTLGSSTNQTFFMPDGDGTVNRYDMPNPVSLLPNTSYKIRVYPYDIERNGSLYGPAYANPIIWDDFAIYATEKATPIPAAVPFTCDDSIYIASSTAPSNASQLSEVDTGSFPFTFNNIGNTAHSHNYNAMGYRTQDNLLYGIKLETNHLLRIGSDGAVADLGPITGLPAPTNLWEAYDSGDVFPDGYLYIHQVGTHDEIYKIDVTTSPPSVVQTEVLSQAIWLSDFAYNPVDNKVYGIGDQGEKFMINPTNWNVSTVGSDAPAASYGAAYTDNNGNIYIYKNNPGTLYLVDFGINGSGTGNMTEISTAPNVSFNDGASCRSTPPFKDFSDAPATYGQPSHALSAEFYLGAEIPDIEVASLPGNNADGDDNNGSNDEDGVSLPALIQGQTSTITVTAEAPFVVGIGSGSKPVLISTEGYLQAWIDWNGDGDFDDASEQIATNLRDGSATDTDGAIDKQISFEVTVPATTTTNQTYARFRWSDQSNLDTSSFALNGEVEDYALTISEVASCTALSGDINAGIAPSLHLRTGDKIYLASNSTTNKEGHLKAFSFDSNGTPSSTVSWDAALQMDAPERAQELFSTDASGDIITFNTLDDAAFETNGIPDAATIRGYTVNPAASGGLYLNGRRNGSYLGTISPNSNLGLLDNTINVMAYLDDTSYRTHYTGVVSLRTSEANATKPKRVFLSSDDGFLYAFDQYDGDLGWGWTPRSLVKELKDFSTFQDNHFMQGAIDVMDLKNTSDSSYATYLVGSYRDGLGQYVLRLDANGDLDEVVWDTDYIAQSSVMNQAPNHGKRAYFSNSNGRVFSSFITTNISDESTLYIRSLTDDTNNISIPLTFKASSSPFVSIDLDSSTAPAAKTLYLGSSTGDIYAVSLFTNDTLKTGSQISQTIAKVASLGNGSTSPVTHIGIASSATTSNYYLRAQSAEQLTVFSYDATDSEWDKKWTSYSSGAGKWLTPEASSLTADSDIQSLPTGAVITNEATIIAGSIVVPVMHAPTGTNCYGDAYYYFYKLEDGHFPDRKFFNSTNGAAITSILNLGVGNAKTLHLTNLPGKQKQLGIGIADQTSANGTGVNKSFYIKDAISTGIRSWREIR